MENPQLAIEMQRLSNMKTSHVFHLADRNAKAEE